VLGEAGLKKVIVDQKSVFYRSGNDATEAMVRGKRAIYLGPVLSDRLRRYEKAGMKFDMRAFGNGREVGYLGTDGITVGVFNRRPHPNATKVFLNWVLSKRISAALAKIQQMNSRRKDIANVTGRILKPGVKYIESQRNEATPVFRKVRKILKKLRP
jgi:ABC-type Fe3+ transport system substrate-binding protein